MTKESFRSILRPEQPIQVHNGTNYTLLNVWLPHLGSYFTLQLNCVMVVSYRAFYCEGWVEVKDVDEKPIGIIHHFTPAHNICACPWHGCADIPKKGKEYKDQIKGRIKYYSATKDLDLSDEDLFSIKYVETTNIIKMVFHLKLLNQRLDDIEKTLTSIDGLVKHAYTDFIREDLEGWGKNKGEE